MEYYWDSPLINYGAASLPDTMYVAPEEVYAPEAVYYTPPPVYSQEVIYTPEPVYYTPPPVYSPPSQAQLTEEAALRAYENAKLKSFGARGEMGADLEAIQPEVDFKYSPAALQYLQNVNAYTSEQGTGYNLTPMNVGTAIDRQTGAPMPLTSAELEKYAQTPVEDQFYANFNYSAPDSAWNVGNLQFAPNRQYRIIDRSTGDVLYSGTGYEAGAQASKLANDLFQKSGKMANWSIEQAEPGSSEWSQRYQHEPETDPGLGLVLGLIAPALGAAVLPALGTMAGIGGLTSASGAATTLGTGLGSALGTGALGAAQGKSLGDILKSSALSGLSAAGLQELMGTVSNGQGGSYNDMLLDPSAQARRLAANFINTPSGMEAIGSLPSAGAGIGSGPGIIVAGVPSITGGAGAGLTGGLVSGVGSAFIPQEPVPEPVREPAAEPAPQPDEIVVPGRRVEEVLNIFRANPGISVGNALFRDFSVDDVLDAARQHDAEQDIVVKAQKPEPVAPPVSGIGSAIVQPSPDIPEFVAPPEDTIVVENKPEPVPPPLTPVEISGPETGISPKDAEIIQNTQPEKKGLSTLDYVRLGLLAPRLISGVADLLGGGDNTVITPEQSRVNYNPLNRQQTISGIGGAPFDVFTYGQNKPGAQQGEYAFFKPYTASIGQQTYIPIGSYDRYTQADVDAANAAKMQAYNTQLGNFNTYQDTLAQQVGAGAVTPEQAKAMAQQYATGLGYEAAIPALKDGGSADGDGEMSDEMVRHLIEWNRGNGHRGPGHVKGIGSGQEDLIPAWLSDGEYVWSAQDVADLGDGSTDEGVRRLDKMRQMVRGRAGRKDVKKIAKPQRGIEHMLKAVGGKV